MTAYPSNAAVPNAVPPPEPTPQPLIWSGFLDLSKEFETDGLSGATYRDIVQKANAPRGWGLVDRAFMARAVLALERIANVMEGKSAPSHEPVKQAGPRADQYDHLTKCKLVEYADSLPTVRARKALRQLPVETVLDLTHWSEQQLGQLQGIGPITVSEIAAWLKQTFGVTLPKVPQQMGAHGEEGQAAPQAGATHPPA